MNPYFSICIPIYNRCEQLPRLLDSLFVQTFQDFEVILVDDGSTDGTEKYIKSLGEFPFNFRYFWQKNSGKYMAINEGLRNARGKYFIILDSDDRFFPYTLQIFFNITKAYDESIGVVAKACMPNKKVIGDRFPKEGFVTSYIDFHFGTGFSLSGNRYKDCCECNLTNQLRENLFPENIDTKFIPESFMFNSVGLSNNLVATNQVLLEKNFLEDGITNSYGEEFNKKYHAGILCDYVNDIDVIFKKKNIKFLAKFVIWLKYWHLKKYDKAANIQVKKVTWIGYIAKLLERPAYLIKNKYSV